MSSIDAPNATRGSPVRPTWHRIDAGTNLDWLMANIPLPRQVLRYRAPGATPSSPGRQRWGNIWPASIQRQITTTTTTTLFWTRKEPLLVRLMLFRWLTMVRWTPRYPDTNSPRDLCLEGRDSIGDSVLIYKDF